MITKTTFLLIAFLLSQTLFAQVKKEIDKSETKMDLFVSKTGIITKFIDSKLSDLKLSYGDVAETRIRKLVSGSESRYFYQIEKQGKYSNNTASIEYSDLLEVIKAMKSLKVDVEKDVAMNPDYLENKFTTVDGFQVGYYVTKGKSTWYLKLEKYGSDNTVFIKDGDVIEIAFNDAKAKIEELKK